jgi:hypothetical protein
MISTLASFVIQTDSPIPVIEVSEPAFDSPKLKPSIVNVAISRELDSRHSIETITPNAPPINSDISFSAVDGSRPYSPALQGPDLKNSHKQVSESKKRLPSAYIEKYFE